MGIGVSNWNLARAVSLRGQLGVVSGTALNSVLVRRLQDGDLDGAMRRALDACPLPNVSQILEKYFVPGGIGSGRPYKLAPMFSLDSAAELLGLTAAANFVEVHLAKENHGGLVGINLLEKIQLPTLASLYGAMLAKVDYVLMGAGIPKAIPGVLDRFAAGEKAEMRVAVEGTKAEHAVAFDPAALLPGEKCALPRPKFLAIVSSSVLALTLARKSSGKVDGFVVEGATAGGHNAPPRGGTTLNDRGEPIYGPRDTPDLAAIKAIGLPFYLAGSQATPDALAAADAAGATGVQVGTAFAFCRESGLTSEIKSAALARAREGALDLRTDPRASPTGMPFKVVALPDTVAAAAVYDARPRRCDLGYLRDVYAKPDGSVGYRCPAEPVENFAAKSGDPAAAAGRKCLCNGLLAAIGLGQRGAGNFVEPPIVTAGDDVRNIARYLEPGATDYGVDDVLRHAGI
ncbi:MAG: nitronate monooxygenase [Opitutae bacterium]|nr:nitronate monooxygenase [Opitutae bacterium]